MSDLTLLIGGRKSGKSRIAARMANSSGRPVAVVAPCEATDEELAERIARHRADRPRQWQTIESFDLPGALAEAGDEAFVIVDALDTWLTWAMGKHGLWSGEEVAPWGPAGATAQAEVLDHVDRFVTAARRRSAPAVVIAGTVGDGIHPLTAGLRRYLDLHGLATQRIGAAGRVQLVVAGQVVEAGRLADG